MLGNLGNLGNLAGMMKNLKTIQDNIKQAQSDIALFEAVGTSEDETVTAIVAGNFRLKTISIRTENVDASGKRQIEESVLQAVNQAIEKVKENSRKRLSDATGGIDIPGIIP
jgi:DNA-binding YbaB/EbfC family protein